MPDLPGFGGMDNFYKISLKPSIDAYADYLAAFIKLRYKRKRLSIYAVSYGFVVVTRMLQRYPEIAKRVDILVGAVGFMHKDDIVFKSITKKTSRLLALPLTTRPIAFLIRYLILNRFVLKKLYFHLPNSKRRMLEVTPDEFDKSMDFEVRLWQANDVRTHWITTRELLVLDNCQQHVALPVTHIVSSNDYYLNNIKVEEHMRQVFSGYKQFTARSKAHVPSVIADKKTMAVMLPIGLRRLLNRTPGQN
jgi:pimeloyl-ACP methyl ester carboxylesterase